MDETRRDQLIVWHEFINNYKDVNTWNVFVNCIHLNPDDDGSIIQFAQTEFILCIDCVSRLYKFLLFIDTDAGLQPEVNNND